MGRLVIEHPNGTAHRLNKYVQGDKDHPGLRLSGKTGTTDDGRDGYFILMMPEYVVAVRLGRDNNDPLDPKNKAAGSPLAVDVVGRFLERVKDRLPRGTDFTVPQGIEFRAVDDSGVVTSTGTPGARLLPFSAKHLPPARPEDVFMFRHNSDSKTIYEVGTSSSAQAQNNETEETSVETATTSESPPPMFPQEE
jgi:membrane carboxypeptidase/penicillin-binding protein